MICRSTAKMVSCILIFIISLLNTNFSDITFCYIGHNDIPHILIEYGREKPVVYPERVTPCYNDSLTLYEV